MKLIKPSELSDEDYKKEKELNPLFFWNYKSDDEKMCEAFNIFSFGIMSTSYAQVDYSLFNNMFRQR